MDETLSAELRARCAADGEFAIAARDWTGGVRLESEHGACSLRLEAGKLATREARADDDGVIVLSARQEVWDRLLALRPPRFFNDVGNTLQRGEMTLQGDPIRYAQYYPAIMRAVELLRPPLDIPAPSEPCAPGAYDAPVGRYVHLEIGGQDYRIYYEEAGTGVPMLLQHTAGCHGSQWRHVLENRAITDRFRVIAYDLPFHGKSLPPVGPKWWAEPYRLTGEFLRAVPVALARALQLDRPAFMGCSVGGMLALDLAHCHPEVFSSVISIEGGLKIDGDPEDHQALWHPQVSNEYKARLMNALMSPTSPEAYRKETSQVYASGWPPVFLGDLHYYMADYDLRADAGRIDTSRVGVHILSGEYDPSGTMEHGQAAHAAIPGSTWTPMEDVGHFPMCENPEAFFRYLYPILDRVEAAWKQPA